MACLVHVPVCAKDSAANQSGVSKGNVMLRADDIGWRYKMIDGKMYKRLYNYTDHKWIGEWIPV